MTDCSREVKEALNAMHRRERENLRTMFHFQHTFTFTLRNQPKNSKTFYAERQNWSQAQVQPPISPYTSRQPPISPYTSAILLPLQPNFLTNWEVTVPKQLLQVPKPNCRKYRKTEGHLVFTSKAVGEFRQRSHAFRNFSQTVRKTKTIFLLHIDSTYGTFLEICADMCQTTSSHSHGAQKHTDIQKDGTIRASQEPNKTHKCTTCMIWKFSHVSLIETKLLI